jgi:acetyltransferase-like isoleucine patch superfamily enzyme
MRITEAAWQYLCFAKSIWLSRHVDVSEKRIPIIVNDPFLKVKIVKSKSARLNIRGRLWIMTIHGGRETVYIHLSDESVLDLGGHFTIGNGVKIFLDRGAALNIKGKKDDNGTGITGMTRLMVRKRVDIGFDFLCGWNVFITDCDWHSIDDDPYQSDTIIGDRVWISPNCQILKGSRISDNCVVATGSVVHKTALPPNHLGGGNPFRPLKSIREWKHEID